MAWKRLPVITKDKNNKSFTEDQLINLNNIAHFRKWVDDNDGSTEETVGYSVGGRQYIIDMTIDELETKLNVDPAK